MPTKGFSTRAAEWPLLILALAVVGAICVPLWQWNAGEDEFHITLNGERLARMFLGAEQIACYAAFLWGALILLARWGDVRRQRRAFRIGLLPDDGDERILPEDTRCLERRVEELGRPGGPYLLAHLICSALSRFRISRSVSEATSTLRSQADLELGRMANAMSTTHYLAWAIPSLGFIGTVRHIGLAIGAVPALADEALPGFLGATTRFLAIAFDTTLVALLLSLLLMFLLHRVQRDQEALVLDCQQCCVDQLIGRFYELSTEAPVGATESPASSFSAELPWR